MLKAHRVHTTLHATDMQRAKHFYADKLGLEPLQEFPFAILYECGEGTRFSMSPSSGEVPGTFSQMSFIVEDIAREVEELKSRGVVFEEYDSADLKTVNSIADYGSLKGAWFKDSEGNLVGLVELTEAFQIRK